jgi:hypothetical protein
MSISVKFIFEPKSKFTNEILDLKKQEHRYDSIQRYIDQHRSNTRGFLIAGHLNEKNFCKQWQEKVKLIIHSISYLKIHFHLARTN